MKILYFAKIKEVIGKSEDSITINEQTTVKDIVEKLKLIDESYKLAFQDLKNIKCSVNCNYINSFQTKVTNKDEIAFFPSSNWWLMKIIFQTEKLNVEEGS